MSPPPLPPTGKPGFNRTVANSGRCGESFIWCVPTIPRLCRLTYPLSPILGLDSRRKVSQGKYNLPILASRKSGSNSFPGSMARRHYVDPIPSHEMKSDDRLTGPSSFPNDARDHGNNQTRLEAIQSFSSGRRLLVIPAPNDRSRIAPSGRFPKAVPLPVLSFPGCHRQDR